MNLRKILGNKKFQNVNKVVNIPSNNFASHIFHSVFLPTMSIVYLLKREFNCLKLSS